jgi:hypothetical protein
MPVPMAPQIGASFLPSIASLLAPQEVTHLQSITTQPSHMSPVSSGLRPSSVESQDNPLPGSGRGSALSSLLLAPLQALSQACHEETGKRKEIQDDFGLSCVSQPAGQSEDGGEKEPTRKRRRKSAD